MRLQEIGAKNAERLGILPVGPNPLQIQVEYFKAVAGKIERFKQDMDADYCAGRHQTMQHEVIEVPGSGALVAASGMFSDRNDISGAPAFMMVNLVPEANRHVLVLSFSRSELAAHQPYLNLFRTRFQRGLRELTSRLIVLRIRSLALRPSLWNSLPSPQQEALKAALAQPEFPGDLLRDPDPKINLFEAVT